jgi:hypothetical protein
MRRTLPLSLLAACAGTPAATTAELTRCAVSAEEQADLHRHEAKIEATAPFAAAVIDVAVHAHIILSDADEDAVTEATLAAQLAVLNDAFAGGRGGAATPFRFHLASIDRTVNPFWAKMTRFSRAERAAKTALRRGGAADLNVYVAPLGDDHLGWATFPQKVDDALALDGIVVRTGSLPGGDAAPFDLGLTAVHEAGHWLGLYHTFHHGCEAPGDHVLDTPRVAVPNRGCPVLVDSCPSYPGDPARPDPVHNYMDYTDDECMLEMSGGQVARMRRLWPLRLMAAGPNP